MISKIIDFYNSVKKLSDEEFEQNKDSIFQEFIVISQVFTMAFSEGARAGVFDAKLLKDLLGGSSNERILGLKD